MTGIIKTDQLQGAQSSTITVPSGNNLTVGGTLGVTGAITGTLATAAQTNITSVGTLSFVTVNGTGTSNFTSTATSPVQINGTSIPTLTVRNSTTPVELQMRATTSEGLVRTSTNHPLVFAVNASEKVRIDGSGNLLVGTTNANPAEGNVAGIGLLAGNSISVTDDGGAPIQLNRKSSDGSIAIFRRDGSSKGNIGTNGGDLYIAGTTHGLKFDAIDASTMYIRPTNASGTNVTGQIDLGQAGNVFRDAYVSGGVYFAPNAYPANYLDDYEEGTWTPTVNGLSGTASGYQYQIGHYIKVGQLVFAQFRFTLTNKGNISGNYALIQGLPFNHSGSDGGSGMVNRYTNLGSAVSSLGIELGGATPTAAWLTKQSGTSGTSDTYVTTADIQNNTFMQGTLIYRTG